MTANANPKPFDLKYV